MTIATSAKFGHLVVVSSDKLGRRVACECVCRKLCIVSGDDLLQGLRDSCGCQPLTPINRAAYQAARIANARQRELAWRRIPEQEL
jgi:hypothetical protein